MLGVFLKVVVFILTVNGLSEWEQGNILKDITYLELIPIGLSMYLWGNQWHGKKILFHSDNQSVVEILNSCTSKSERVMKLVFWSLLGNFHIKAQFIPGFINVFADLISRGKFQKFKKLAPLADIFPTSVPETFWKLLDHSV